MPDSRQRHKHNDPTPRVFEYLPFMARYWKVLLPLAVFTVLGLLDAVLFGKPEVTRGLWATLCLLGGQWLLVAGGIVRPLLQALRGHTPPAVGISVLVAMAATALEVHIISLLVLTGHVDAPAELPAYTWAEWQTLTTYLAVQALPWCVWRAARRWVLPAPVMVHVPQPAIHTA